MLFTWIFALSGINEATQGSPALNAGAWGAFFTNGEHRKSARLLTYFLRILLSLRNISDEQPCLQI
jgi:hypothetical protein